jgi:Ca-activated chloride channel family protein
MFFFVIGIAASLVSGQFASGVAAVEVYATVTDARGEPIEGLTAADFIVREDGMAQTVNVFSSARLPLALALGIDRSFSMTGPRLTGALSAARGFVTELAPSDETMVLGIGSEVETVAPLSTDRRAALQALDRLDAWGTTPLFDATLAAIDAIQAAHGRRALILLSDGTDRFSHATAAEVIERARGSDVLIYPIALGKQRPPVFAELASVTGARSLHVTDTRALPGALSTIARELRQQYLLGYTPTRPTGGGGEWRAISVSVTRPGARVRARDGYISR